MKSSIPLNLLLLAFSCPVLAQDRPADQPAGTTYYVDNGISSRVCRDYAPESRDCGDGTELAFRQITAAAGAVTSGSTVLIQPGNYEGGVVVRQGGTENAPVVFRALAPDVVIDGSADARDAFFITEADYVTVDGLTIQNANRAGLRISQSDHVTVRNSTFMDNGSWGVFTDFSNYTLVENCEAAGSAEQHGIYISNSSDNPTIRGNRLHHNAAAGVHMNGDISMGGDGIISNALIENNVIYENGRRGGSGINLDGVTHSLIRNNLLYENQASGISLYRIDGGAESHDNRVLNNTIIMARFARWAINLPSTRNNKVFNNIVLNNNVFRGSILVEPPVAEGFESDYNVVMDSFSHEGGDGSRIDLEAWQALGYDTHSLVARTSELFVSPFDSDYRLKAGSPAIDTGTALPDVPSDLDGSSRPAGGDYDIGAYEYRDGQE